VQGPGQSRPRIVVLLRSRWTPTALTRWSPCSSAGRSTLARRHPAPAAPRCPHRMISGN